MTYEFTLHYPGYQGFEKKTGQPIPYAPVSKTFEAVSNTEAATIAREMFIDASRSTPDSRHFHYNVGRAS